LNKLPVFGYGFSMGAVATIEAQAKDPNLFNAIALDCPFDSTENLIKKMLKSVRFTFMGYEFDMPGAKYLEQYAFHPYVQEFIKFLLKTVPHMDAKNIQTYVHRFSPAESIKKVTIPCFFIHCKNDPRVSADAVMSIYNGATGYKRMWLTNGRWHYDSIFYNPEKYSKRVTKFFESVLDKSIFSQPKEVLKKDQDDTT
jgi:pimeloyl-ACP methyl ester carboxylesterase